MSAELACYLTTDQERLPFGGERPDPRQAPYGEPTLLWDKIADRWPKERFPSFISCQVTVEVQHW